MMDSGQKCIVVDIGSGETKAGFAGEDTPLAAFQTTVGRRENEESHAEESYVGEEAQLRRDVLKLNYPVEHGNVVNWDDMEKIWKHLFSTELEVNPAECVVLLTEPLLNPNANREKMVQLCFEKFNVPALYVELQPLLALYGTGRTTGCVLDSGEGITQCVPIYQSYGSPHTYGRMDFGGRDLSAGLLKMLTLRGLTATNKVEAHEIARQIKERHCYVALDFDEEKEVARSSPSSIEMKPELPVRLNDSKVLSLCTERFLCPEVLFQPALIGRDAPGVHEFTFQTIQKCGLDIRRDLFSNVVLSGGTTLLPGFAERLLRELSVRAATKHVQVVLSPDRQHLVWKGGSILGTIYA